MLDGAFSWTVFALGQTAMTGISPQRGNELLSGGYACYNVYETADNKFVSLGAVEYKFWLTFCQLIGHEEYAPLHLQMDAQPQLKREVAAIIRNRTREQWVAQFAGYDFCFAPVLEYDESLNNEQILSREMVVPGNYGGFDTVAPGLAVKLSATPGIVQHKVPGAGEHTIEILQHLGYGTEEIEHLLASRIITGN